MGRHTVTTERTTTDGKPPAPGMENEGAPQPIDPKTGQHKAYWVLSKAERSSGYVRPLRDKYVHRGIEAPKYELRDLTPEEQERHKGHDYVKYEAYPEWHPLAGQFWTQERLDNIDGGCGTLTRMAYSIAQTYAKDPTYYGKTFCAHCRVHLPVAEFTWNNSQERVGS